MHEKQITNQFVIIFCLVYCISRLLGSSISSLIYPIFSFSSPFLFFYCFFFAVLCFKSYLMLHFADVVTYTWFVMQDPDAVIMFSSACKPVPTTTMFWEVLTNCISYLMYTGSVSSSTGQVTSKYFFQRIGSVSILYHKKVHVYFKEALFHISYTN